jgi:hypothetical protein
MPILSPRYFRREECRRELFAFASQAASLGVDELICPILYVPVDGLAVDSPDEALSLVARAQYESWVDLRLCDERSSEWPDPLSSVRLIWSLSCGLGL